MGFKGATGTDDGGEVRCQVFGRGWMNTKAILGVLMLVGLMMTGCAALGPPPVSYEVYVSSFGNSTYPPNATFVIQPGSSSLSKDDPEFQEYAEYLQGVLEQKGFQLASVGSTADFEVTLNYGISDGSTNITSSDSGGIGYAWSNGLSAFNNQTSYTYNTTFRRTCQVVAYDLATYRSSGQWKQVWRTQMVSVGNSSDLRHIFPIMLAAGFDYLGQDSYEQKVFWMQDDDPMVRRVELSLTPPQP